jgi:lipid-binding SYLF domain-containing protein
MKQLVWMSPIATAAAAALMLATPASAATGMQLESDAHGKLADLKGSSETAEQLSQKAEGILVFPNVVKAGLGIGGGAGDGVLFKNGQPSGFYRISTASVGLQAGIRSESIVVMFMTKEAMDEFSSKGEGWKAGTNANIAILGAGSSTGVGAPHKEVTEPVVGFIFAGKGLMAGLTLDGSRIKRINK